MMTIDVIRQQPPELATCRSTTCRKRIEWVTTLAGKRMPVDHPLLVERVHERNDGTLVSVIDAAHSHFVTCPDARRFRQKRGRQ